MATRNEFLELLRNFNPHARDEHVAALADALHEGGVTTAEPTEDEATDEDTGTTA